MAITPKCPVCWAAYLAALGSFGISIQIPYQPWLLPLLTVLLVLNLAAVYLRARTRGQYAPFLLCSLGVIGLAAGKYAADSPAIIAAGLACVIAGSIWNAAIGRRSAATGPVPRQGASARA